MRRECAVVVDGQLGNNAPVCMTGSQNLRRDLCRVNFEVHNLKPFPHLAFPHFSTPENRSKKLGFDGELMASSPPTFSTQPWDSSGLPTNLQLDSLSLALRHRPPFYTVFGT